jgi:UrcA family protein
MWFGPVRTTRPATTGIATEENAMKTIALIAAGLLAGSGLAHAEDATTVVGSPLVAHVPYQPSDLVTAHGVRELRGRVRNAAHELCQPSEQSFMATFNALNCLRPTLRDAFAQVDSAVARSRSGQQANAGSISVLAR